jgi:hypothetical protein
MQPRHLLTRCSHTQRGAGGVLFRSGFHQQTVVRKSHAPVLFSDQSVTVSLQAGTLVQDLCHIHFHAFCDCCQTVMTALYDFFPWMLSGLSIGLSVGLVTSSRVGPCSSPCAGSALGSLSLFSFSDCFQESSSVSCHMADI